MKTTSKVKGATLLLFSAALLLVGSTAAVRGQSALDGFNPNANDRIYVVVAQPDGKILIGGGFTTLSPNGGAAVTRNRIARLNSDGTLDTAFNPNASGLVVAIAVQTDGKILVGGGFTSIGGQPRNRVARLNPDGTLDTGFDPNANAEIHSIAVQADGQILVAGNITSIGGVPRKGIARLNPATGLADSFDPNAGGSTVSSIVVQADGLVLVCGYFTTLSPNGGAAVTRNRIARLNPDGTLDTAFDPNANGGSPFGFVRAIAVQANGKILAGGFFTSIGGQTRNNIARLDPTTGLADSFDPNANSGVVAIAVQADGKILAGGGFTSIGGQPRNRIARLDATTGLADSFNPNANNTVDAIAVQADGKILAGGLFSGVNSIGGSLLARNHIARLETDGRLDQTLDLITASFVYTTALQADGKILIGGTFTSVLGVTRNRIARLNTNGTLDLAFDPSANSEVDAIAVQADGQILVGGYFDTIGGETRNGMARLDPTTGLADAFDPNASNDIDPEEGRTILAITVQADGQILVGGLFTSIGGQTRNYIARLDPATGLADAFDPNANSTVFAIAVQADGQILAGGRFKGANSIGGETRNGIARLDPITGQADSFDPNAGEDEIYSIALQADGQILAGGAFSSIGGATRNGIARLDSATGLADAFDPAANNIVYAIVVQADGKILAGGAFNGPNSIGGEARNYIARLDPATGLADSFDPAANNQVFSIAVQTDGKILAAGLFTNIGGQARNTYARLSNDTAALQNLAVTQTTITWTRGGSSPLCARATFESSTDNVNYTLLGDGAADGNNWILTGLNLPTGQNIYIRGRGYYRSGYQGGSESTTESVRNAFLAEKAPTPINISGTVIYCSNPVPGPVPNVTLTLAGTASGSALSDVSGNYAFPSLPSGGNYTVTPTKTAWAPGTGNITGVDAVAVQRHFLNLGTPLSGCKLAAADVTGNSVVDGIDAVAIQRFFLGLTTGIANVGKYQFSPASRTYSGVVTDQTGQDYNTLVFGDVASGFVHRSEGGDDRISADELVSTVATVALPEVAVVASVSDFVVGVKTTTINGGEKLVGFQGDFTFDERVVSFQSEPVQKAGLTGGNWNVSGNVLDGPGPIRTLRVLAYSNDFTPISGEGTLFELRMTRTTKAAQGTQLIWAAAPDQFIFIDADLNTQEPGNAAPGSVTSVSSVGRGR